MPLQAATLPGHLKRGLLPVYLVTGDEPLLVNEALDTLRAAARDNGFLTRELLFAERGFDWNRLTSAGQSMSLFSDRQLIDLRLPTGKPGKDGAQAITEFAEQPPPDTLLLISAPRLDGSAMSSRWVKSVDQAGAVIRVWPLQPRELPDWIEKRMRDQGLTAERDAVLHLARRIEGNLLAAQQEIDKLVLLHEGRTLTAADIDSAVADSSRFDVFQLADEALAGRVQRAVRMLGSLRREGVSPVLMVWAIGRELRTLAVMREALDAGASQGALMARHKVWKNRQAMVAAGLQRLDRTTLYRLVLLTEQADRAAKGQGGGEAEAWRLLLAIVTGFASGRAPEQAA